MSDRIETLQQDRQWKREFRRRVAIFLVILAAFLLGLLFVRWISREVGLGRIGEFYGQADELANP